jgi:hypothetical protein
VANARWIGARPWKQLSHTAKVGEHMPRGRPNAAGNTTKAIKPQKANGNGANLGFKAQLFRRRQGAWRVFANGLTNPASCNAKIDPPPTLDSRGPSRANKPPSKISRTQKPL